MRWISILLYAIGAFGSSVSAQTASYQLKTRYPIPGNQGWDYITIDSAGRRLYVSHGIRVNVLDADTGEQVGTIEDTPGVHGIAIARSLKHGFTSNGKEDTVTMFDIGTLSVIKKISVGKGPDGIYFDSGSQRVFTNNHRSHNISVIDAANGEVVGTVNVGGDGEGAATGRNGLIYVALEDKNEVAVFDPRTLNVKQRIPLTDIERPTGLAFDAKNDRIFVGGHNKIMLVLDGISGRKIASLPTGAGTDAAGFDPKNHRIFFSNGEGNLTIIRQRSADDYVSEGSVATQPSAKTMALDENTQAVFLPAANVISTPAADPAKKPTKAIVDGTFGILVMRNQ